MIGALKWLKKAALESPKHVDKTPSPKFLRESARERSARMNKEYKQRLKKEANRETATLVGLMGGVGVAGGIVGKRDAANKEKDRQIKMREWNKLTPTQKKIARASKKRSAERKR